MSTPSSKWVFFRKSNLSVFWPYFLNFCAKGRYILNLDQRIFINYCCRNIFFQISNIKSSTLVIFHNVIFPPHWVRLFSNNKDITRKNIVLWYAKNPQFVISLLWSHNAKDSYIKLHVKFQDIYLQIVLELSEVLNWNFFS